MDLAIAIVSRGGVRADLDVHALTSGERREQTRTDTARWIKRLRLVPYGGTTMRERFTYRGDSLWWFTEIYLQKTRRLERAIATVLALDAAMAAHEPAALEVSATEPVVRAAGEAFGRARGVPVTVTGPSPNHATGVRWSAHLVGWSARLSRLRPRRQAPRPAHVDVAAFVHNAFWRDAPGTQTTAQERYIGPVLEALGREIDLSLVGVGPRRNFRARRWWDPIVGAPAPGPLVTPIEQLAPQVALADSMHLWHERTTLAREIVAGEPIREAAVIHGCDLWDVLKAELADAASLQWPWSARAMDEAGAALDTLAPAVALTYAEAGGWGRAVMLEARRRGIPSVGLQHGFIYRHWLNYAHEVDEIEPLGTDRGFPRPDRTLLFDEYASHHLREHGHLPASSLVVTGSAGLDALARDVDRLRPERHSIRAAEGVAPNEHLAVLAAKFGEVSSELPSLGHAISAVDGLHLVVKPHPAETAEVYENLAAQSSRIRIAPADVSLARLLAAADLVITMNSTVAIDCLVLGVPALVVGLPNNLSPFVEAGVMVGTTREGIEAALARLLRDQTARDGLIGRAAAFAAAQNMRADGQAAARAAREILALVERPRL